VSDQQAGTTGTREMVVTRVVDAPVAAVWRAWTEPEQVMRWWGPAGFSSPLARMDVREGGTSLVCMRSPAGQDLYNTWTYRTVAPPRRLEFVHRFADEHGTPLDPAELGLPVDVPAEVPHRVTFDPLGDDRTRLTVTESGYTSARTVEISRAGMEQCLDKLADALRRRDGR
jgi:uncharacterized protein YndB with AHSA1/START domain